MKLHRVPQCAGLWRAPQLSAQQDKDALHWLLPTLSKLSQDDDRWICLIAPPSLPCVSVLQDAGIDLSRVLLVHPGAGQDGLWAVGESLRSGTCSAVLAWAMTDDRAVLRCLQLAARTGNTIGFLFRPKKSCISDQVA